MDKRRLKKLYPLAGLLNAQKCIFVTFVGVESWVFPEGRFPSSPPKKLNCIELKNYKMFPPLRANVLYGLLWRRFKGWTGPRKGVCGWDLTHKNGGGTDQPYAVRSLDSTRLSIHELKLGDFRRGEGVKGVRGTYVQTRGENMKPIEMDVTRWTTYLCMWWWNSCFRQKDCDVPIRASTHFCLTEEFQPRCYQRGKSYGLRKGATDPSSAEKWRFAELSIKTLHSHRCPGLPSRLRLWPS